jgi:hypothetical protein
MLSSTCKWISVASALMLAFGFVTTAHAEEAALSLEVTEASIPDDVAESIGEELDTQCIQMKGEEGPVFEFWFRKALPVENKPGAEGPRISDVAGTTLLGVARIQGDVRDFRDDPVDPGVYTLRMAVIPKDGNHMGTSPHDHFALLIFAELDTELDGIPNHSAMVRMSQNETAAFHPVTLNLHPVEEKDGAFPRLEDGGEWKYLVHELPVKADGEDAGKLAFKLVYEGHGEL